MVDKYDRRVFIARGMKTAVGAAALGGGASALLAACSSSSAGSASSGSSSSVPVPPSPNVGISSLPPRRGGKLLVGTLSEVDGLAPASPTSRFDATGFSYANAVLDPLAVLAQDGTVKPYLAESFTPSATYDAWTVKMRPNVVFHDGTPCNADALLANLTALKTSILTGSGLKPVTGFAKVDDLTLTIQMDQPWVSFPAELTSQGGYLITPKYINPDGSLAAAAASKPVGTGPFIFSEWVPDDHFTATRNPHYWRPGLPYLDAIEFRPLYDDQAREATLRSGGINLMHSQDPQNYVNLTQSGGFQVYNNAHDVVGEPSIDNLILNCQSGPTSDLRIRQALAFASDREKIRAAFFNDIPELADGLFMPGDTWYAPGSNYPTLDLAKSKQLVQAYQADHPGPVNIELSGPSVTRYTQLMDAFQTMWQAAGINVTINSMQQDNYTLNLVTGKFQVGLFQWFNAADPDQNYVFLDSASVAPPGAIGLNLARNADTVLDGYLDTGRRNPDPQARIQAYQNASRRLVADLPYLFGWQTLWIAAGDDKTMNFRGLTCPDRSRAYGFNWGNFSLATTWLNT